MERQQRSVYRRGADDGLVFGAYLIVLVLLMCGTPYVGILAVPALAMAAVVPFIIYRFLRRSYVRDFGLSGFSELWLQGIITFVCGTMLMAVAAYIFMRFVKPDFVVEQVNAAIGLYRSAGTPESLQTARALELLVERRMVPGPIYIVIEMMLMGIFTGSILSMIVTWIVRLRKVPSPLDDTQSPR